MDVMVYLLGQSLLFYSSFNTRCWWPGSKVTLRVKQYGHPACGTEKGEPGGSLCFISTLQFSSVTKLCPTFCNPMDCSTPGFPVHHQLPELAHVHRLMSIESVIISNHLILCRPLLLLPSIFPSISVFSNESALHIRWPKYWSFSFSISPSNEYSGPISFRMDWLDHLAVQQTLKSLL